MSPESSAFARFGVVLCELSFDDKLASPEVRFTDGESGTRLGGRRRVSVGMGFCCGGGGGMSDSSEEEVFNALLTSFPFLSFVACGDPCSCGEYCVLASFVFIVTPAIGWGEF